MIGKCICYFVLMSLTMEIHRFPSWFMWPCFTLGYHFWMNCYLCEDIEQSKVFIPGHSCMQVHDVFSMKLFWGAFDLYSGIQLCCTPQIHLDSSCTRNGSQTPPCGSWEHRIAGAQVWCHVLSLLSYRGTLLRTIFQFRFQFRYRLSEDWINVV
jgi:hypothetical protein